MDIHSPSPLLGGLTPAQFMRTYWHKKPLLVRQAIPGFQAPIRRAELFALAGTEGVESRLVQQRKGQWSMRHGPFARRSLPALQAREWTLLVQGVDLHEDAAHALMQQFRFIPEARMDDLMISYASDGGGVGPHFDSYDVFLLQAHGQRRWRIGRQKDFTLKEGIPLKVLENFVAEEEFLLEPGDLLYLPPRWAHDGVAEGECMTYSVGFRSPSRADVAQNVLVRLADEAADDEDTPIYRDPRQEAVAQPGAIPAALQEFARDAVRRALADPLAVGRALGESMTEPKPNVWFDPAPAGGLLEGVVLDRRTRMLYDDRHVFINGESYRAGGRDATLMRRLADQRSLSSRDLVKASDDALELLSAWCDSGWVHSSAQPG